MPKYCVGYKRATHTPLFTGSHQRIIEGLIILELDFQIKCVEDIQLLPKTIQEKLKFDGLIEITSVGRL